MAVADTALAEPFTARANGLRVCSSWHPLHGSVVMLVGLEEAYHHSIALSQPLERVWIAVLGQRSGCCVCSYTLLPPLM